MNPRDMINFYCTFVRPVLEYCSPISIKLCPTILSRKSSMYMQKRPLSIILPDCSYSLCLSTCAFDLSLIRTSCVFKKNGLMPLVWRLFCQLESGLARSLEVRDVGIKNLNLSLSQSSVSYISGFSLFYKIRPESLHLGRLK